MLRGTGIRVKMKNCCVLLVAGVMGSMLGGTVTPPRGQVFAPIAAGMGTGSEEIVDTDLVFEAGFVRDFEVDGSLSNPAWETVASVPELKNRQDVAMACRSDVRFLYSPTALYVGAKLFQPMEKMFARIDQHDLGVWNDDNLEMFFFVPDGRGGVDLYQWVVNPIGAYYDSKNGLKTYNTKGMVVRTQKKDDCWLLEMKMPYDGIKMPRALPGDFIGARFCREVHEPKTSGAVPKLKKVGNQQRSAFAKLTFREPKAGELTKEEAQIAAQYRGRRKARELQSRVRETERLLVAQEAAMLMWRDVDHPAVDNARLGVDQMRRAFDDFKAKKIDEATFLGTAAGFAKFVSDNAYVVYPGELWEKGDPLPHLPTNDWTTATGLQFAQAANEREQKCLVFTGLLSGPRYDLRIVPQHYSHRWPDKFVSSDQFEIYEEPYVLLDSDRVTAPLVRKDGNMVTLSPGHATRVWVVFNSRGVPPGEYPMSLALKSASDKTIANRKIDVNVKVWNFTLPETRDWPVKSFFWGPNQFNNDEAQALRLMHDHHVTHGWTKAFNWQYGITNDSSIVEYMLATGRKKPEDGRNYDVEIVKRGNADFLRTAKELGMRFVIGWGSPHNPEWFQLVHDRCAAMGFAPEDYVFKSLIADEFRKADIPKRAVERAAVDEQRKKYGWWFQAVYLSTPPPAGATMDDIEAGNLPEFYKFWTVIRGLTKDPKRGPDVIRRLKAKDCSVWSYECSYYMQTQPILSYYRLYPTEAYTMGLDGAAVWTSGGRKGDDGWDSEDGYDDGICWVGNDRKFVTTKRFEAFREGLEDVAYLDLLKKAIVRGVVPVKGKQKGVSEADLAQAKTLVEAMEKMVKGQGASLPAVQAWRDDAGSLLDRIVR